MNETTKAKEEVIAPAKGLMHNVTQVVLPVFTVGGFLLTSLKMPQYGLISNMISQIFWFYAAWKAYKHAGQIGILLTTVLITISILIGIINYWVLN